MHHQNDLVQLSNQLLIAAHMFKQLAKMYIVLCLILSTFILI